MKPIVSPTSYMHGLNVTLEVFLVHPCFGCDLSHGVQKLPTCGISVYAQAKGDLGAFQILDFQIRANEAMDPILCQQIFALLPPLC